MRFLNENSLHLFHRLRESKATQEKLPHVSENCIHYRRKSRPRLPDCARTQGHAGTKVVIGSRDLAQGEQAVAKLRAAGVDADVLQFDITKPADHKAAYDYFNSKYGRLDILVNNAGIAAGTFPGTGPEHSRRRRPPRPSPQGLRDQLLRPGRAHRDAASAPQEESRRAASSTSPASLARSPCTPTPNRPSTTPSPSPTTPPRPPSTPSPSIWPTNSATPKSRSTPPIPAGSRPTWAAIRLPWN